ncbi:endonuclease/exonuclease/phosphatase family protein [Nocardia rhamnosiphila]|uniref:endonuclease/exonuclease/phosphatase family protein n=1 Tax=Nocardia rhamnosiphila TaxID=426716 RepID=UPI00340E27A2
MSKSIRTGIRALAGGAALAGAAGVALHFSRSSAQPMVLGASIAPYLMGCAPAALAVWVAVRQWRGAAVAALVTTAAAWTQIPLYLGPPGPSAGPELTVMQANLLFDGADPRALIQQVRDRQVGVLTVNELRPAAVEDLGRAGLDEVLPYRYLSPGRTAAGTGIWSAYPLSETVEYDGFVLNQLAATATIPGVGPVTVYAFHPVPPVYGTQVWADELSRLRDILDRSPGDRPVIAGGDFNATHDHAQFRALVAGRFHDAAEQAGAGHLVTYPTDKWWPPVVGIDHIVLAEAHATAVDTVGLPGADHRALVARIQLPGP